MYATLLTNALFFHFVLLTLFSKRQTGVTALAVQCRSRCRETWSAGLPLQSRSSHCLDGGARESRDAGFAVEAGTGLDGIECRLSWNQFLIDHMWGTAAHTFADNPVPVLRALDGGGGIDAMPMTDGARLIFDCGVEGTDDVDDAEDVEYVEDAEGVQGVAARGGGAAMTGLAFAFKAMGASSFCGAVAKAGFRIVFITLRETSMTKSPPSAISAIILGQSRRSKLKAAKELITRRRLS